MSTDRPRQQVGVRCQVCKDVVYSNSRHDFEECLCGASYIDGGYEYNRVGGNVFGEDGIEWVMRDVPVKGGKRDQPWAFKDEPERKKVVRDGLQPSPP